MLLKVNLFLFGLSLLISVFQAPEACQYENLTVATKLGLVKGSIMETRKGKKICAFRGIHYAESPTEELRFQPAIPIRRWNHVFDASKEGPACMQAKGMNMSENCLTLNIYTKQLRKKLPVIVYIFPGKFTQGSGQSFLVGPKYLLDHDVVLVTINYRLATLGFINTGDKYAPGNLGLKDQVIALRFIRDNIEKFGGDPNSVTLTGQSAGSRSIILHLLSPMSKGLFHRVIAMSGTMTTPIPPLREQTNLAIKQAKLLNCSTNSRDEMFRCLRERPAKDYGKTINSFLEWQDNPTMIWYPSVESEYPGVERFLSDEPETLMKLGKIHNVSVIIGVTQDEYSFKVTSAVENAMKGDNKYFDDLNNKWCTLAPICFQYKRNTSRTEYISQQIHSFYFGNQLLSLNNSNTLRRLYANSLAHFPIYRSAILLSKYSSAPVYFYKFTYEGRYSGYLWSDTKKPSAGAAHGDDLQYIFNIDNDIYHQGANFPMFTDNDPEMKMVNWLTTIWAHFAKTNDPSPKNPKLFGNFTWMPFEPENEHYLNIGETLTIQTGFMPQIMKFYNNLFP